jgi:uncharacterized protein (DUF1810 family)
MTNSKNEDKFDLARFVSAQADSYSYVQALKEVSNGKKQSHWMWYVFPQLHGLGHSSTSQRYGIAGANEAYAYLEHELLGPRLIAICEATISIEGRSATDIFGKPDDMKLRSCATLFAFVSDANSVFHRLLDKYFDGKSDERTVRLLVKH